MKSQGTERREHTSRTSEPESAITHDSPFQDSPVDLRCSAVLIRDENVLLIHRDGEGYDDWVLPGGRPRPKESTAACVRREVREETGLDIDPQRCALVLEVIDPRNDERTVEIVFVGMPIGESDLHGEPWKVPTWVPLVKVRELHLRPPIGGYLPGIVNGSRGTAAYLGNMWRPPKDSRPSVPQPPDLAHDVANSG